jgi:hypothetical protein
MSDEQDYLAYLLRLWQITSDGNIVWRASVESPHTGERHGFADLQALFAFLEEKTGCPTRREAQAGNLTGPARAQTSREAENT